MKINEITSKRFYTINFQGTPPQKTNTEKAQNPQNTAEPAAYKDHVSGRLFRTPEDFYAQPFNQNGMPDTMKVYLQEDFETRQHIPPMQVMQLVFSKINDANSLDEVKTMYPEEKLFKNLTSSPKIKTTVITDIEYIKKDNPNSAIFQNGDDNLGLYLLKKVYLESKTLSEIDKDFQEDINPEYKGIAHLKDETLYSYGIRRPQSGFWHSLVHNRENFPYVYIPRTKTNQTPQTHSARQEKTPPATKPTPAMKPRRKLTDEQKRAMSEYMLDFWKNLPPEERERRKNKIKLGPENSFLFQYIQPIMTLAAAQVNLSDKLYDYLSTARLPEHLSKIAENAKAEGLAIDLDSPNEKQRAIMKAFWNENNNVRGEFGKAIRNILDEFQQAYGVDGENPEFQILLKIADDIRTENAERVAHRRQRKADVEAAFKDYTPPLDAAQTQPDKPKPISKILEETLEKYDAKKVSIDTPKGEYNFIGDFREEMKKSVAKYFDAYPKGFVNRYLKYIDKSPIINNRFIAAYLLEEKGEFDTANLVMPKEEVDKISAQLSEDFLKKNIQAKRAASQTIMDILGEYLTPEQHVEVHFINANKFYALTRSCQQTYPENNLLNDDNYKNRLYNHYMKPLSSTEITKILNELINYLRHAHDLELGYEDSELGLYIDTISKTLNTCPDFKPALQNLIRKQRFIENSGGALRSVLNPNQPQKVKYATCATAMCEFADGNDELFKLLIKHNPSLINRGMKT